MFVNGVGASEYGRPVKAIRSERVFDAKLRSAPELDNLVEVGLYATDAPDGKNGHVHKNAVGGFSYYVSIFKVGDEFFSGVVNVMNGKKGRLFKDVTQIKSLQLTTAGSSEPLALASFVKQALSKVIVAHQFSEVKQNSVRGQTSTPEFKRWFGDSKVVDEDGKPKVMYHGTLYGGFTVFRDWQYCCLRISD